MTEFVDVSKIVETREEEDFHITAKFDGDEAITVRVEFQGFDDHQERAEVAEWLLLHIANLLTGP